MSMPEPALHCWDASLLFPVAALKQVLNLTAAWWFENTRHITPNALLSVPHPNVSIMRKCTVFPVEFVVRGFMTGARGWPPT
jgi:phosphoribosylaminoimidazole-succinocarboxamide synthase